MRRLSNPLAMGSAVQYLLSANLAVFAVLYWFQLQNVDAYAWLIRTFGLIPACITYAGSGLNPWVEQQCLYAYQIWQPFTYMFLHGGIWHVGFNMLALWMFGTVLERVWGMKRFFQFYLFCGVGAGLTVALVAELTGSGVLVPTIGASGAVLGLLLAFGKLFPDNIIYLYFIPVKARYAVWIFGAFSLYFAVSGNFAGISHVGHLGGLLFGWIYMDGHRWWSRFTRR